ncbi:hypothetical protein [Geopsychrobacter electrodiphilus]|uniref:hypothetical protein n=1 Tax=Geopsychrobacter electrodiphilus TaxID=225196 RepID=UPI00037F6FE9|nr:hypothetical protein [Geopsychrobacter electrodiphilus]
MDIFLCTSEKISAPSSDILLCPHVAVTGDIELCASPCATAPALFLTGSDAPSVGDIYSASGGIAPYTYSYTGGTINPTTGEILTVLSCVYGDNTRASAIVSVMDDCGVSAAIVVRQPGGGWVMRDYQTNPESGGTYSNHVFTLGKDQYNITFGRTEGSEGSITPCTSSWPVFIFDCAAGVWLSAYFGDYWGEMGMTEAWCSQIYVRNFAWSEWICPPFW